MKANFAVGLILILVSLTACGDTSEKYVHSDFVSSILQEDCFVCGDKESVSVDSCWSEDNVGILDLNTFDFLRLTINRYDDYGQLIEEPAGYVLMESMQGESVWVYAMIDPDRGYASVEISGALQPIDAEIIQSNLCQNCLDVVNRVWVDGQEPSSYAVVNFSVRSIQPLMECYPWFTLENYGISTQYKKNGDIKVMIFYCPPRYS